MFHVSIYVNYWSQSVWEIHMCCTLKGTVVDSSTCQSIGNYYKNRGSLRTHTLATIQKFEHD